MWAYCALEAAIEKYAAFAASTSEEYAHIDTEEKQKVAGECASAQAYLADARAKLDALPKTETPPIKCAEIVQKADALASMAAPIMNTPKPLPPSAAGVASPSAGAASPSAAPSAAGGGSSGLGG